MLFEQEVTGQPCSSGAVSGYPGEHMIDFVADSGNNWRAIFTLSSFSSPGYGVAVSDIRVTPL